MKIKHAILFIVFILFGVVPALLFWMKEPGNKGSSAYNSSSNSFKQSHGEYGPALQGLALSLKALQQRLSACGREGACPDELLYFAGMTRITGYAVDSANMDLVLLGERDPSMPPLHLEDFIVAYRNARLKYAEKKRNTYLYSAPGCSIDPQPAVMLKLQGLEGEMSRTTSPEEMDASIDAWRDTCRSPQSVAVLGIPFHSRFSWVMVKADYDMKQLANGSDALDLEGFTSWLDLAFTQARAKQENGDGDSDNSSDIHRFWFYPGENSYVEDEGIVSIKACPVVLLTEQEHMNRSGEMVGEGRADPLALEFCRSFSRNFHEISRRRPIYANLENLFRFVALVKILEFKDALKDAGLSLNYLLDDYVIPRKTVDPEVPGCFAIRRLDDERSTPDGRAIYYLRLPVCGGVGIDLNVKRADFKKDHALRLLEIKRVAIRSRPDSSTLMWTYAG